MRQISYYVLCILLFASCRSYDRAETLHRDTTNYGEKHRPQLHFSPKEKWMNDPNGMVYHDRAYHLFYQFYPDSTVWGPMHWGHAVSSDLVSWQHLPIALYPDTLGYIFSGSAVVDVDNTSGFGSKSNPPVVAIYTYHSAEKEKAGANDYQTQGIAYSLDNGRTWTKYAGNPVIKNPGLRDFRDPKVFWHGETRRWVMSLAVSDHIEFWASPDLKSWQKLSDFGKEYGSHGGVWECPDLIQLQVEGSLSSKWVLIVSINPGGPNGGSGTQYFIGDFDGVRFSTGASKSDTAWVDYGPDNYAGVTWYNAPDDRKIFLGWMSNWAYGQEVPTSKWRSAMTIPRDLTLVETPVGLRMKSSPSPEFVATADSVETTDLSKSIVTFVADAKNFTVEYSNDLGQKVSVGYDAVSKRYFIDRGESGNVTFSKQFSKVAYAPRTMDTPKIQVTLIADDASIEAFFDGGVTSMTAVFFPDKPLSKVRIDTEDGARIERLQQMTLRSIWR